MEHEYVSTVTTHNVRVEPFVSMRDVVKL